MGIISLKRYLNGTSEETPLRQIISSLIAKIGSSAVEGDHADCMAFREHIRQMGDGLAPDLPPDNLMVLAGGAVQALTVYNKKVESFLAGRDSEVTYILSILQETVVNIAGENTRAGKRLQEITGELEQSG